MAKRGRRIGRSGPRYRNGRWCHLCIPDNRAMLYLPCECTVIASAIMTANPVSPIVCNWGLVANATIVLEFPPWIEWPESADFPPIPDWPEVDEWPTMPMWPEWPVIPDWPKSQDFPEWDLKLRKCFGTS